VRATAKITAMLHDLRSMFLTSGSFPSLKKNGLNRPLYWNYITVKSLIVLFLAMRLVLRVSQIISICSAVCRHKLPSLLT
jgi:hypothetical protein